MDISLFSLILFLKIIVIIFKSFWKRERKKLKSKTNSFPPLPNIISSIIFLSVTCVCKYLSLCSYEWNHLCVKSYKFFPHRIFLKHHCVLVFVDYITDTLVRWYLYSILLLYTCTVNYPVYWIIKLFLFSFINVSTANILIPIYLCCLLSI